MAYALSRKMEEEVATLVFISFPTLDWIEELKESYDFLAEIRKIVNLLLQGAKGPKGFALLLRKGKLVIVPSSPSQAKFLQHVHSKSGSWAHGMKKDVKKLVRECQICQVNKNETSFPTGLLQPLP